MQHFDEQPMKRETKLGVTNLKSYHVLQHTSEPAFPFMSLLKHAAYTGDFTDAK